MRCEADVAKPTASGGEKWAEPLFATLPGAAGGTGWMSDETWMPGSVGELLASEASSTFDGCVGAVSREAEAMDADATA